MIKKFTQLIFAIVYALICMAPSVWSGSEDGWSKSIYQLPLINMVQILIYPAFLILLFVIGLKSSEAAEFQSLLGALISVVNLVFLVFLPTSLERQVKLGWPRGNVLTGNHINMRVGYYLLYALTIIYLTLLVVQWRLSKVREKKSVPTPEQAINAAEDDDWRPW